MSVPRGALPVLAALSLLALAAASASHGAIDIAPGRTATILAQETGLLAASADIPERDRVVVWFVRTPRVLAAGLVGAALALSGALLQGLFRNPLASPSVIGVSSGAALGATLAIALGLAAVSIWAVPVFACVGAALAGFVVYALATRAGRATLATLLLCGVAVNSITGAATSLVLTLSTQDWEIGQQIVFWLMGGLANRTWEHVGILLPFLAVAVAIGSGFTRELDVMLTGEESALALGVDTAHTQRWVLVAASGAAGAAVAVAGVLGFVGLIVPHMVRLVYGPGHRSLLPASLWAGAGLLILMDWLSRAVLAPREISLGILTAGLGGPFFLYLLLRYRKREGLA